MSKRRKHKRKNISVFVQEPNIDSNKKKQKKMSQSNYYNSYGVAATDFSIKTKNSRNIHGIDVDLIRTLLAIQGPSRNEYDVQMFIINWVNKNIPTATLEVDNKGNIYIIKNTNNKEFVPSFVAHMDEVNDFQTDRIVLELDNVLIGINSKTGKPAGCPGDDRVGCYICLEMLRLLDDVKVAFFVEEEIGCLGSGVADISFFSNSCFILQADRRDCVDFITHTNGIDVSDKAFQNAVEPFIKDYGLKFASGTATDVGRLVQREVGCCCANIGSGYYSPHSLEEKVCISDVENIMNLCFHISMSEMGGQRWAFTKPEPVATAYTGSRGFSSGFQNNKAQAKKVEGVHSVAEFSCKECLTYDCMRCNIAVDDGFRTYYY